MRSKRDAWTPRTSACGRDWRPGGDKGRDSLCCRRAFIVSGRDLTTSELMELALTLALHRGKNSQRERENHAAQEQERHQPRLVHQPLQVSLQGANQTFCTLG